MKTIALFAVLFMLLWVALCLAIPGRVANEGANVKTTDLTLVERSVLSENEAGGLLALANGDARTIRRKTK